LPLSLALSLARLLSLPLPLPGLLALPLALTGLLALPLPRLRTAPRRVASRPVAQRLHVADELAGALQRLLLLLGGRPTDGSRGASDPFGGPRERVGDLPVEPTRGCGVEAGIGGEPPGVLQSLGDLELPQAVGGVGELPRGGGVRALRRARQPLQRIGHVARLAGKRIGALLQAGRLTAARRVRARRERTRIPREPALFVGQLLRALGELLRLPLG